MEAWTELIEITADNHAGLGRPADDVGCFAIRRPGEKLAAGAYYSHAEALDSVTDATTGPLDLGEALPVGSGRRWMVVPHDDADD